MSDEVTRENITDEQIDAHLELTQTVNQLSAEFNQLCQQRHIDGAQKYGSFSFLGKNMIQEAGAELADLCNYARYCYIKLRLMELQIASHAEEFEAWRQSMLAAKEAPERPQHGFTPNGG